MAKKPMKWYTQLLGVEELPDTGDIPLSYRPVPDDTISAGSGSDRPVWRVRFDPLSAPEKRFGLDINGEVILGRGNDAPDLVDLTPCNADKLGVSRRHLTLRPTPTNLFVVDLGSTNGTWRNGHSIGVNTPYSLVDGDTLALGGLQLIVHIVHRPSISTAPLVRTPDLADALLQIAKAITSQLDIDEVLNQVAATAMSLTSAGETGIWLVDEESGELFLEAERGINDEKIHRTRLPIEADTPAARVVKTGQPLRATRQPGKDMLKMMTNYLVESMVHVPITLGGITFGVLAAAHRQPAKEFDERDEELLAAIADFAAIAIQNARLYQATDKALEHRVKELAALNEVSRSVTASLDLDRVYEVLVEQVNKHWPVEVVRLYLLDERQGNLYTLGQDPDNTTTILLSDKGIMVKAARSGHTVVANDAQNHPDYNAEVDCLDGEEPQSVAYIPLVIKERVVGVLALYNKVGGIFSAEDISRLETFANPVATAIENARLFEESERQRAAIQATAETLSQPLLLLDEYGNVLVSNQAASQLLDSYMAQVFEAVSRGVGRTIEAQIGNQTFLSTTQHLPDVGTIVVMQDITYVKQLEQDRSEFVHMLSHDLKNPLMAINGWTSLIEKTVPLDERGERYVTEIESAAGRMLEMVNELLQTVTRDDAVQLVREPCDVEQIVTRILRDVEGAALHKSIVITYSCQGDPYPILADETRLYHMVLNLIDNAIKYSPKNTAVKVRLNYNDDITIHVQDEGPGIPEEDIERIFNKYYRGRRAPKEPGSGLGLAAVRAIAVAHGGTVMARNLPERGTEFTVTLPSSLRLTADKGE